MKQENLPAVSRTITFLILVLMSAAAAAGLAWEGLYRDNPFVTAVWRGNDLVALLVGVPLLGISLIRTLQDSRQANLIRIGVLDYALYNYAFYLFAAAFNDFFLVYSLLVTLSLLGLIFGLAELDPTEVKAMFRERTPVRWVGGFQIFVALGLSAVYGIQIFGFLVTGFAPEIIAKTGHVTHIVPALDLTLVVPWLVLGGVWIWQEKPWGYIISSVMTVKGILYMLTLTGASLSAVQAGFLEAGVEVPLWGTLGLGFLVSGIVLGVNSRKKKTPQDEAGGSD